VAVLEDLLAPGLSIVFCGTGAGRRSAELKAYYAGRGNRFWPTLFESG
jgi:TDG/mug DNA glycosylase family protein